MRLAFDAIPPRHSTRHHLLGLVASVSLLGAPLPAQSTGITLDHVLSGVTLTGVSPARPVWSPDSRWVAFLWNDAQRPARDLWIVSADGRERRRLDLTTNANAPRTSVAEFFWQPDSRSLVILAGDSLRRVDIRTGVVTHRAVLPADANTLTPSPDGASLAFLSGGDIQLLDPSNVVRQLTTESKPFIGSVQLGTYARRDVEFGTATWAGDAPLLSWSPDGRRLAAHRVDRRNVTRFQLPYYLGDTARMNVLRRGAPGEANERRDVVLVDVGTSRSTVVDLQAPDAHAIVGIEWSPTGALLIDRQSDDAIERRLHVIDANGTTPREVWSDPRRSRVYTDATSAWHPDGRRILVSSDRDDRYRLLLLDPSTGQTVPLTPASGDLLGAPDVIRATGRILFASNDGNAADRQLYLTSANGGASTRVTTRRGTHTGYPSPNGVHLAVLSTDDVTPTELWLSRINGQQAQRVTSSPAPAFATIPWIRPRYITVTHRSEPSVTLHARVYEPPSLDRTKRHPVLFGPVYSNTVRNRWGGQYGMLQQYLALAQGYIVVQVDVRGSTGYGRDFRESFLMDWGGRDLTDLESVVDHIAQWPTVDRSRIGIWGSSYGGTLTVYSMLRKPGLFASGVAGAPAVDPRWFGSDDVAIARRPQSHPDAFVRGKVFPDANGLRDPLLIIHGMEDDVVPFQTSVVLFDELLRLGKPVDLAFAPAATHGWSQRPMYARYLFGRLIEHFNRTLKR
jgi:dipeptidyl-peptidase 4